MNWRKTLLVLILLPALLYVGARGYLWYSIKNQVDEAQRLLAQVGGRLEYGEIDTSLMGPVGVRQLTLTTNAISDRIDIGSVLLHTSGPIESLKLVRQLNENKMPERINVSLDRIVLPLDGELAGWLDLQQSTQAANTPLGTFGCGKGKQFGVSDLVRMGYNQLVNDIRLEYSMDRRQAEYALYVMFRTRDAMSLAVDLTVPSADITTAVRGMQPTLPPIRRVSISYEDESYNKRKLEYCAKLNGTTPAEFLANHVAQVRAFLVGMGFVPSDELMSAYQKFMSAPTKLTVNINPYDALDLTRFRTADVSQLLEWLGLEIEVDGTPIKSLGAPKPEGPVVAEGGTSKPEIPPDTYKLTPISELDKHLNRLLKVYTVDGKLHHAYLDAVGPGELTLTQQLVGGSATFTVPITDIARVLVLY